MTKAFMSTTPLTSCHPEPAVQGEGPFSLPVGSAARQRRVNQRRVIAALRKNEIRGSFVLNNRTQDDRASIRALKQLSVGSRKDTRFSVSSVLSVVKVFCLLFFLVPWCLGGVPPGSEYHGVVTFGGLPLPGATITATQAGKQFVTSSDLQGLFSFPRLRPESARWKSG